MGNLKSGLNPAIIFDIQRFSLHDGPGIRTTVFFKGCPLRCAWCQNPESHLPRPQPSFYADQCTLCLTCKTICPENAILEKKNQRIDHLKCTFCGLCATVCPEKSIVMIGRKWTCDELLSEILKDIDFYKDSKGGVTFSGGEPMLHSKFLKKITGQLKIHGIHVNIETCGVFAMDIMEQILPFIDMIYFDLKHMNTQTHKKFTGFDNTSILENFSLLSRSFPGLQPRMPVIPGINDTEENIIQTALFLKENNHETIHCLPFHNMGEAKLQRIKSELSPVNIKTLGPEKCSYIVEMFKDQGIEAIVYD